MEYKRQNLDSYNLHTVKLDTFKESRIEIIFRNNISKDDYLKGVFLTDLLTYSSNKYPNRKDIVIKSEELYQLSLFSNISRLGKSLVLTLGCNFINPEYVSEQEYLKDVVVFLSEILFNPNIKENAFDETAFRIIQNDLLSNWETINENPMRVASYNAFNLLDDASSTKIFLDNYTKEDILNITPEDVYEFYNCVLEHFVCDVIIVGNLDFDEVSRLLKNNMKLRTIKNHEILLYEDNMVRRKPLKKTDLSSFNQSTILLVYNLVDLSMEEKTYVIHLFDYIFCNGSFKSKLFKTMREDNSLCYGVSSFYMKFDKMYGIKVSLAKENVNKALKLIDTALKEMSVGNFDNELIEESKKAILNSLKTSRDSIFSFSNDCFLHEIDNFPGINERIKAYRKVTKEEIVNLSNKLKINISYVLEDGANNARN